MANQNINTDHEIVTTFSSALKINCMQCKYTVPFESTFIYCCYQDCQGKDSSAKDKCNHWSSNVIKLPLNTWSKWHTLHHWTNAYDNKSCNIIFSAHLRSLSSTETHNISMYSRDLNITEFTFKVYNSATELTQNINFQGGLKTKTK